MDTVSSIEKDRLSYLDAKEIINHPENFAQEDRDMLGDLREFILQDGYPCVGAQAAVHGKTLAFGKFKRMDDDNSVNLLSEGLHNYLDDMYLKPGSFLTYVALFPGLSFSGEMEFEQHLWNMLGKLHSLDALYHDWCPNASKDPSSPDFSYSFGGKAFFIVGMHPKSSRKARRFKYPAVAFNLQEQFDRLREKGRFEPIKEVIRQRDMAFDGSINPMLSDVGEGLQAPQYSGRKVGSDWKCPFNKK